MRVITGTAKGKPLSTLKGDEVRPTTDRVKEGMFSIIQFDILNSKVLDLFAGSGQLGIEALSRGAKFCAFVDVSNLAIKVIKDNINNLKINETEYQLIKDKDISALEQFKNKGQKFDLVFLDPPYEQGQYQQIVE